MAQNLLRNRRAVTEFTFEAGCTLAQTPGILPGIYALEGGHPCDGCACKPCDLLEKFKREDKAPQSNGTPAVANLKTNAELAAEFNITKRQAAKRRIQGTNELATIEG